MIDTNIAIHLRDRDREIMEKVGRLGRFPALSIMSLVELEAGVFRNPALTTQRRAVLDALLEGLPILDLDRHVIAAYGRIIAATGFSRARVIDRLIAATAIANGLTLATINADDFRDIPGLTLDVWAPPAQ